MRLVLPLLLFVSICANGALAQNGAYTSTAGGFSAVFPGRPEEKIEAINSSIGNVKLLLVTYIDRNSGDVYQITFSELPPLVVKNNTPEQICYSGINEVVQKAQGKIIHNKAISYEGYPGSEIIVNSAKGLLIVIRSYLVSNRLYRLTLIGPANDEIVDKAADFLSSFKLTKNTERAATTPPAQIPANNLSDPKSALAYQLKLLKAGDREGLAQCFIESQRARITAQTVARGRASANFYTIDDLVAEIIIDDSEGLKTAKIVMKNGRTLTTLVYQGGRWLSTTIWFN